MPEIGEVARIVHYLRKHLTNRRIASVQVQDDTIVYGKVGTTAAAFASALTGKTVLDARRQGKYFWLVMDSPPHPLMHFGMTGWVKFRDDETGYYKPKKEEKNRKQTKLTQDSEGKVNGVEEKEVKEEQEWPPRFWKFNLQMEGEPRCEASFIDARRLARIRLVDVPADEMRNTTPLKENGPDPVIDKDILTPEWLIAKMGSKRVPVKALLLDQGQISGVGNWVADEILYNARIHPEQYSNTLGESQVRRLHKSMVYICTTACDLLADSEKFPEDWLMKFRWDKGKKGANVLPNGEKIVHLTVGGRTSAVVPSLQKKTGPVAGDVKDEDDSKEDDAEEDDAEADAKPKAKKAPAKNKKAPKSKSEIAEEDVEAQPKQSTKRTSRTKKAVAKSESSDEDDQEDDDQKASLSPRVSSGRKRKATASEASAEPKPRTAKRTKSAGKLPAEESGRRRSARIGR